MTLEMTTEVEFLLDIFWLSAIWVDFLLQKDDMHIYIAYNFLIGNGVVFYMLISVIYPFVA